MPLSDDMLLSSQPLAEAKNGARIARDVAQTR